jgi:Transposase family tnp2
LRLTHAIAKYHENKLLVANPLTLISVFIVLILNIFGRVTRSWCNVTLNLLKLLLGEFLRSKGNITPFEECLLKNFPRDVRTVRKVFDVEATTVTYAACPKCSSLSPPKVGKTISYPARCQATKFRGGKICGTALTKRRVQDGESVRVPVRPFTIQDFDAFMGNLLSRPGIEDALDRGTILNQKAELSDVQHGSGLEEIKGPDGKPFMDGMQRGQLRLAWSLSVDWFNPYQNKIAGKSRSVGSIALALLNLPPSLRNQTDCMYLFGVIPGPREPSLEQINHFLKPLIDIFLKSWKRGTRYSKTYRHPEGRDSSSAIAMVVADLPGSRKVGGTANHSANIFCNLCDLTKDQINNLDLLKWTRRTYDKHLKDAEAWRDAPSEIERKKLFKRTGVRWSELLRLPYFDPTRMIVVDPMHNLFLGLVQFHCRQVLNLNDAPVARKDAESPSGDDLDRARIVFENNPTEKQLGRLKVSELRQLGKERGVVLPGKAKKADIISALVSLEISGENA